MSANHKKKSMQSKNRKHQEKMAHRKKQIQSGTSLDRHHRMYCAGIPKEQSPEVKSAIEERLAKGV